MDVLDRRYTLRAVGFFLLGIADEPQLQPSLSLSYSVLGGSSDVCSEAGQGLESDNSMKAQCAEHEVGCKSRRAGGGEEMVAFSFSDLAPYLALSFRLAFRNRGFETWRRLEESSPCW